MTASPAESPVTSIAERFVSGVGPVSPAVARLGRGDSPPMSIDELEHLAGTDPEFTLRLLALANSAFYSQQHEVTSLRCALVVLGVQAVHNLAACLLARSLLSGPDAAAMAIRQHSQAVGVAAQILADLNEGIDPKKAFVAGLLHDIGMLAVFKHEPDQYRRATRADTTSLSQAEARDREWVTNEHGCIGAEIAELLGLAPELCAAIRCHGRHEASAGTMPLLEAAILVADRLANDCGYALPVDCGPSDNSYQSAMMSLRLIETDLDSLAICLPQRIRQSAGLLTAAALDAQ